MTGIILGGYGFGAFIFGHISTLLVNPNGENPAIYDAVNDVTYYDCAVADRVPFMFRVLVYIWSVLVFFAILLIKRKEDVVPTATVETVELLSED